MMWPMPGAMALSEHLLGLSLVATPLQLGGRQPRSPPTTSASCSPTRSRGSSPSFSDGGSPARRSPASAPASRSASRRTAPASSRTSRSCRRSGCRSRCSAFTRTCPPARSDGSWSSAARGCIQALSNGYFLLFFPVLVVAWLAWFVDWRRAPGRGAGDCRRVGRRVAAAAAGPAQVPRDPRDARADAEGGGDPRFQRHAGVVPPRRAAHEVLARRPGSQLRAVSLHRGDGRAARCRRPRPATGRGARAGSSSPVARPSSSMPRPRC